MHSIRQSIEEAEDAFSYLEQISPHTTLILAFVVITNMIAISKLQTTQKIKHLCVCVWVCVWFELNVKETEMNLLWSNLLFELYSGGF